MISRSLGMTAVLLAAASLGACRRTPASEATPEPALAQQATDTAADTQTLSEAVGAANEVVRNAADCEAAKAAMALARQKFDEVEPRLRTPAAQTSLAALRRQVERVAELCP